MSRIDIHDYEDTELFDPITEKKFQEHCVQNLKSFPDLRGVPKNSLRAMFLSGAIVEMEIMMYRKEMN